MPRARAAGPCCFNAGHYDEAIPRLREALEHGFVMGPTYHLLGAALGHVGRSGEALDVLEEGMRAQPNLTLAHLHARNPRRTAERILAGWKKAGWSPPED